MQATIDNKKIVIHNVDAQNVFVKCKCPRCDTETNLCLIDYGLYYGKIECGFCANEGWDDCAMPVVEIEYSEVLN